MTNVKTARLTLADLVERTGAELPAEVTLTRFVLTEILKAAFEAIKDNVNENQDLRIHGFGIFSNKYRAERTGRNPSTGAAITIAASDVLSFKPSKSSK